MNEEKCLTNHHSNKDMTKWSGYKKSPIIHLRKNSCFENIKNPDTKYENSKIIFEKKAFVIIQPNRRIQANFTLEISEVYLNPS